MKKLITLIIALFFFLFLPFLARPQRSYTITEKELVELEKITENLRMKNVELQKTLSNLQYLQMRLKNRLRRKEVLLKDLKNSFDKYERETASKINILLLQNETQKNTITRLRWTVAVITTILIALSFLIALYIYFKMIRR